MAGYSERLTRNARMPRVNLLAALAMLAVPLTRSPAQVAPVDAITAPGVLRHINVLTGDSMRGRDTPSPALERTARYVAAQFQALGLRPGPGTKETWFQQHQLYSRLDVTRSHVTFTTGNRRATASLTTSAYLTSRRVPKEPVTTKVVVVSGQLPDGACNAFCDSIVALAQNDYVMLYVEGPHRFDWWETIGFAAERLQGRMAQKKLGKPKPLSKIILTTRDSANFASRVHAARLRPQVAASTGPTNWVVEVLPKATEGLVELLAANGVDVAAASADPTPKMYIIPSLQVSATFAFDGPVVNDSVTAPNVTGMLEGTDPRLKDEYVVLAAHMDHLGPGPGADDNASGVAGLLELAKAFSLPGARPARTLVFLATSGGRRDFSGSTDYIEMLTDDRRVVANLTLDMIGRPRGDSVVIAGSDVAQFLMSPAKVAAMYPELGVTVIDSGSVFSPVADHFAFVRAGVPSLYIHTGTHADSLAAADSAGGINADQEARVLRLTFHLGRVIANAPRPPQWTASGRRAYLSLRPD